MARAERAASVAAFDSSNASLCRWIRETSDTIAPIARAAPEMSDRHDGQQLNGVSIENIVRKRADKRPAETGAEGRASVGKFGGVANGVFDRSREDDP